MKKFLVFPVNKFGLLLEGFCPTSCTEENLLDVFSSLFKDLINNNIKFYAIRIFER